VADFDPAEDTIQLHYDGTLGDAPEVTVDANADGSANVAMDGTVVLVIKTPGDLMVEDIVLKDTLLIDPPAAAMAEAAVEATPVVVMAPVEAVAA